MMINAYWQPLDFGIHEGANWSRVIDTALPSGQDIVPTHQAQPTNATVYRVQERSIVVFATGSTVCSLANGTPMFCAGDEFLRTQGGNGNPFDLDNPVGWIDWDRRTLNPDIFRVKWFLAAA